MTTEGRPVCFVGIGSPHGDDVAGWLVAEGLRQRQLPGWEVHSAATPIDLLDWVRPDCPLWVADACRGDHGATGWQVWAWPGADHEVIWGGGTHDFSLPAVLTLAQRLGRLPADVRLWGIWGRDFAAGNRAGDQLAIVVERVVEGIVEAWGRGDARPGVSVDDTPGVTHA